MRYDTRSMFIKGSKCFDKGDLKGAKYYLDISVHSEEFRLKSIEMLAKILFAKGNIVDARKMISDYLSLDFTSIKKFLSKIEAIEYNYDSSLNYLKMIDDYSVKKNYDISVLKLHSSSLSEAKKSLQECVNCGNVGVLAKLFLVFISIMEFDYETAYSQLMEIDRKKLSRNLLVYYERINMIIGLNLGKDLRSYQCERNMRYFRDVLISKDDTILLDHVKDHKLDDYMCFFSDLNLKKVLEDLREEICKINPNFYAFSSNYGVLLDYPVSFYNGREINGVTVVCAIGTNKIMSFYPTDFSSDFDKEGYSKNLNIRK